LTKDMKQPRERAFWTEQWAKCWGE
jgi:hypothetical protein